MSEPRLGRLKVLAVSVVILALLLLQGLATFSLTPGPMEGAPWGWPFLDYPMFNHPKYPGQPITRHVVVGIFPDSSEVVITPEDLNVSEFQFDNGLNPAIRLGDRATAGAYRELYENLYERAPVGFRLEDHPLVMTEAGLSDGARSVVGSLYFEVEPSLP